MSCGINIPPEFRAAIINNLCASCGGPIMSDAALDLLDEIKNALSKMPNDPEGLAGWLLSNYEMRKIGSAEPVQFFNSRIVAPGYVNQGIPQQGQVMGKEAQLREKPLIAQNKLEQFYQNAGIKHPNNNFYGENTAGNFAQNQPIHPVLARQMALAGEVPQQPGYGVAPTDYSENYVEEAADPEYTQKALAAMQGGMSRDQMREMIRNVNTQEDLEADSPALQMLRMERLKKQQELAYGGEVGKIRRG
jgi:hypothetical protein